jgi:two-component system, OmpR family, response regulator
MSEVRVLIVDDNEDAAAPLLEILRDKGYVVEWADDGQVALDMVERAVPHCVVLDVHMPRLNGRELARRLRARFGDQIVLIAMSGIGAGDADVAKTFDIVDYFLPKPIDFAKLDVVFPPITGAR